MIFNDTATTEIYTLSLHDAVPIWPRLLEDPVGDPDLADVVKQEAVFRARVVEELWIDRARQLERAPLHPLDRKSTRLNSSHANISYAVFCLKTKFPRTSAMRASRS